MKKLLIATAAILSFGMAGTAMAQDSSINVGYLAIDGDGATVGSIVGRYQHGFNTYWALEGEVSYGIVGDTVTILSTDVDIDAKFGAGAYVVGRMPINETGSNLFARIGYVTQTIEASGGGASADADVNGLAYGVGGNFMFDGTNGVRIDYTRFDDSDAEADTYSIAYVRRF